MTSHKMIVNLYTWNLVDPGGFGQEMEPQKAWAEVPQVGFEKNSNRLGNVGISDLRKSCVTTKISFRNWHVLLTHLIRFSIQCIKWNIATAKMAANASNIAMAAYSC